MVFFAFVTLAGSPADIAVASSNNGLEAESFPGDQRDRYASRRLRRRRGGLPRSLVERGLLGVVPRAELAEHPLLPLLPVRRPVGRRGRPNDGPVRRGVEREWEGGTGGEREAEGRRARPDPCANFAREL